MPNITNLTLDQLRAMSGAQIKSAINAALPTTKQGLIEWLMDVTEFVRSDETTQRADMQADVRTIIYEDALGAKTRTVKIAWFYFPDTDPAVIYKVVTKTFDANNVPLSKSVSRHRYPGDPNPVSQDDGVDTQGGDTVPQDDDCCTGTQSVNIGSRLKLFWQRMCDHIRPQILK